MTDKSNVVGASDDDARLTFADDANVVVDLDRLLRLGFRPICGEIWPLACVCVGHARPMMCQSATTACRMSDALSSVCHTSGIERPIEESPQGSGPHLCRRALRGVLQRV